MTRVTVVIPLYRGRNWIRACLESVLASKDVRPRVVVFDNASTDGSHEIVAREFPTVELIENPRNIGFARANNRVIQRAISRGDDYVFLLNEDARIEPDTIAALVRIAESADIGILSPLQYDYEGKRFERDFESLIRQSQLRKDWQESDFVPTRRIIGAAVLMKLDMLRRIGLFDPIYFIYAEEEDLCRRARSHGYRVGITPKTRIYHGHVATGDLMSLERMRRFNIIRGKYILALKNPRQTLGRAMLNLLADTARDIKRVFEAHRLRLSLDFIFAAVQVLAVLGRIRQRRKLERDLSSELWTNREMGIDTGSEGFLWW